MSNAPFKALTACLYRHDPIALRIHEVPEGEYAPEARTILARLPECNGPEAVQRVVWEEFVIWFDDLAGPIEAYEKLGKEVWDIWQSSKS